MIKTVFEVLMFPYIALYRVIKWIFSINHEGIYTRKKFNGITPKEFFYIYKNRVKNTGDYVGVYVLYNVDKDMYYVGQAKKLFHRINQHFTGRGNGDVYADVKYGKYVFVKLFPCPKSDMNDLECRLIESFNGLQSYNRTAGGSKKRKKEWGEIFVSF